MKFNVTLVNFKLKKQLFTLMKGMYFYPVNIMCCTNILCYLSPEKTAIAERKVIWLSFVFKLYILWVRKGILRFRFKSGNWPF